MLPSLIEQLRQELRLAWRRIGAAPGPAIFAIVTLALGVGVAVATYSVVYTALWRPLGIVDQHRVRLIGRVNSIRPGSIAVSWDEYQAFAQETSGFAGVAAWTTFPGILAGRDGAAVVKAEFVTGTYFAMLAVPPAMGRMIQPADDRDGAKPVVVLSNSAWREQFGSDPTIVGTTVTIADRPFEVIGVAPTGFRGVHADGLEARAAWLPISAARTMGPSNAAVLEPGTRIRVLRIGVRLAPGQTPAGAAEDVNAIGQRLQESLPWAKTRSNFQYWTTSEITDDESLNRADAMGRLIVGLPGLVLLIACTNIANLVLSRGVVRRHDFGVRRALGASRWRLIREQLIEQTVIVVAGGAAGVAVAYGLVRGAAAIARETLAPFLPGTQFDWSLDAGVVTAAAVAVLVSIVVAGLIPALHLTRNSLRTVLDSGSAGSTPRWRGRANLIALQVGVSVGLFLIAVVFVKMLFDSSALRRPGGTLTPGSDRAVVAPIPFYLLARDEARVTGTIARILDELGKIPELEAAAVTSEMPYGRRGLGNYRSATIAEPAPPGPSADRQRSIRHFVIASPGIFSVLDLRLRDGRTFDTRDTKDTVPVAVVNEGLALHVFGTTDVVDRQMVVAIHDRATKDPPVLSPVTIVGVIAGGDTIGRDGRDTRIYLPYTQQPPASAFAVVTRSPADREPPVDAVRAAIRAADAGVATDYVARADVLEGGPLAFLGYVATTLLALAFLALGLAMAGLYGVLSHVMARRTREMGIRIALGAGHGRIARLVLWNGFRPLAEGLFIGLATAAVIRIFLKSAMSAEKIAPLDPLAGVLAILLVGIAGALACYLPARRAASVDPNVALRSL